MPWRTLARPGPCSGAWAGSGGGLAARRSAAFAFSRRRYERRSLAFWTRRARRSSSRCSGVSGPRAGGAVAARRRARRSLGGSTSCGSAGVPPAVEVSPAPAEDAVSTSCEMLSGVASGVVFSSAILGLLGLDRDGHGGIDPALVRNRQRAREVALAAAHARGVLQLARGVLHAQAEQVAPGGRDLVAQGVVGEVSELSRVHPVKPSSRVTNLVLSGSLWPARRMASRASVSSTPASSNITRPGLTTATQPSGLPLPEPMRVSAGFFVKGLSG